MRTTLSHLARPAARLTARPATRSTILLAPGRRAFANATRLAAQQDYGSGSGDPKGEKPGEQGKNPREDLEHPGPPAPDVGQEGGKHGSAGSSGNVEDACASLPFSSFFLCWTLPAMTGVH